MQKDGVYGTMQYTGDDEGYLSNLNITGLNSDASMVMES